uniref:Uncharacterized protein n=1 Tax=Sulfolobus islandicus rod-shaped virus 1 TaxID=157898 RepID=Q5W352_SIRV1|nr:hypothetical protein [Sulfolobus islandicus rod-shaped virus 1]
MLYYSKRLKILRHEKIKRYKCKRMKKDLNMRFYIMYISDQKMTNENVKKIRKIIDFFINSSDKEKEINFEKPLLLTRGETIEILGMPKNSILTTRFDLWTELLIYDDFKIIIIYENSDDKVFKIYKIKLMKN